MYDICKRGSCHASGGVARVDGNVPAFLIIKGELGDVPLFDLTRSSERYDFDMRGDAFSQWRLLSDASHSPVLSLVYIFRLSS